MASIKEWARAKLEAIIDTRRVASVADELELLLVSVFTLVFDFKLIVKLLGGRRPSDKGKSGHAAGEWGHTDHAHYKVDVPLAMAGLGTILGEVWTALGVTLTEDSDFGMGRRARDVVSQLSDVNTAGFYTDYFDRLAMASELWRTRPSASIPDIEALGDEAEAAELAPIVAKQDTEAIAESTATRIAEAHFRSVSPSSRSPSPGPITSPSIISHRGGWRPDSAHPHQRTAPLTRTASRPARLDMGARRAVTLLEEREAWLASVGGRPPSPPPPAPPPAPPQPTLDQLINFRLPPPHELSLFFPA